MRIATFAAFIATFAVVTAQPLVENYDFSNGKEGWDQWTGTVAHTWDVVPGAGPEGRAALRVEATHSDNQVMVLTETDRLKPGTNYSFEVWWRFENVENARSANFRVIQRNKAGAWLSGTDLYPFRTEPKGGWLRKHYRLQMSEATASTTIGYWIKGLTGTVWAAGGVVVETPVGKRTFDSMYSYDPHQVKLGTVPLGRFKALQTAGSPFLKAADRWNRLLVDTAFAQEDLARAARAGLYTGGGTEQVKALSQRLAAVLTDLDQLQIRYGRLFDAEDEAGIAATFAPEADQVATSLGVLARDLKQFLRSHRPAPPPGFRIDIPSPPVDKRWWDARTGRPRTVFWNRWSTNVFRRLEEPLNLGDGHTLTAGHPKGMTAGVCDWSNFLEQWEGHRTAGARRSSLITHYSLHDKGYLAAEFVEAHNGNPDLYMWDESGKPAGPRTGLCHINWLNPEVRAHMTDVLTQMGQFFRDRHEFQFCVSCWESAGPYRNSTLGRNPSHGKHFQGFLKQRYATIEALNERWDSEHAGFSDLVPVPEIKAPVGTARGPLYLESRRWAQEAYVDYVKLIRDTLHAADPGKPVLGEHSGLLSRVFSPRISDSVDILGHHRRARTTMALQIYMNSLRRVTGKPTGLFENFWGCQEDHPSRIAEEKVMRAQLRRYLYRHAVWGTCTQTWWYSYTSAPYLLSYNGNWFNPVYDLTTFRYSAAGLPVEKAKVDRLQTWLLNSSITPARLLVVQPYASMLAQGADSAVWQDWQAWHAELFARNLRYEAFPDVWFEQGKVSLGAFDAVILPVATHLSPSFSEMLAIYLRKGGLVIASGPCGIYNELGQPDAALLKQLTPPCVPKMVNGDGAWRFELGATLGKFGWATSRLDQGKMVILPAGFREQTLDRAELCEQLKRTVARDVIASSDDVESLMRDLGDGRRLLCLLNRNPDATVQTGLRVRGAFGHVADVDIQPWYPVPAQVTNGTTLFDLTLAPGGTAYLLLAPE